MEMVMQFLFTFFHVHNIVSHHLKFIGVPAEEHQRL